MNQRQKVVVTRNPLLPADPGLGGGMLVGTWEKMSFIKLGSPVVLPARTIRTLRACWTSTFDQSLRRRTVRTYHVRRVA